MHVRKDPIILYVLFTLLGISFISCNKTMISDPAPAAGAAPVMAATTGSSTVLNSSWSVNWNNYIDGLYSAANASGDFGNMANFTDSRAWISSGVLRIRLQPKALSSASGVVSSIQVAEGTAYEIDYDIRFHSLFDWSRGGKLGFGFLVGDGNTGGNPAWEGNGGSMRLIWYQTTAGRTVLQPYLYYKDQPDSTGNTFGLSYPAAGTIVRGKWYHVHLYIQSNTGSNTDGRAKIAINGVVLLDKTIRWTTNDSKRFIRSISFHTFRGGDTPDWESATLGYIYYDNLVVHRISK
jgi:hypothetical protein